MQALIEINKEKAIIEGLDIHGRQIIDFNPADLTIEQRQELVKSSYDLNKRMYRLNYGTLNGIEKALPDDPFLTEISKGDLETIKWILDSRIKWRSVAEKEEKEKREKAFQVEKSAIIDWMKKPIEDCISPPSSNNYRASIKYPCKFSAFRKDIEPYFDVIPSLQERIEEMNTLCFWMDLEQDLYYMRKKRINQQLENEQKRIKFEKARKKEEQIENWVEEYGTQSQKERLADGLLPYDEIEQAIYEQAFMVFNAFNDYKPIRHNDFCDRENCLGDFKSEWDEADSLTEKEYYTLKKIEAIVPDAEVMLIRHRCWCTGCDEEVKKTGFKVILEVGQFIFSKEFEASQDQNE
jgi:hypothetical protein